MLEDTFVGILDNCNNLLDDEVVGTWRAPCRISFRPPTAACTCGSPPAFRTIGNTLHRRNQVGEEGVPS